MKEISCKLLVIGAGPGGYVCAIRAGQLGIDTVIVEADKPGGTCLNVGCIPSKALIHAAEEFEKAVHFAARQQPARHFRAERRSSICKTVAWKDGIVGRLNSGVAGLLKKAKVKIVQGWAKFRDGKTVEVETETGTQVIRAETVVIATGSAPVELPFLPFGGDGDFLDRGAGADRGAEDAGGRRRRLYRAGARHRLCQDGLEGDGRRGAAAHPAALRCRTDAAGGQAARRARHRRDDRRQGQGPVDQGRCAAGRDGATARTTRSPADKILVTVGRKPVTEGWGLEEIDLDMAGRFIKIDDQCRTSMRGVYAIGDVTGEPMLAHRAMAQGEMVAEIVAGHKRSLGQALHSRRSASPTRKSSPPG